MNAMIRARRWQQLVASLPHYAGELKHIQNLHEARQWLYHKIPYLFQLDDYPTVVEIEVTNECKFACPHCPRTVFNSDRPVKFMPFDLFARIVEEVTSSKPIIKLAGLGEPALHRDLGSMMAMLRKHALRTYLYTNGTLFERWSQPEILEWNARTIVVSIDGTDRVSFERLRKGGRYEPTRAAVENFRQFRDNLARRKPEIEIRHVIMPKESTSQLKDFRRDWSRIGDTVKFNYFNPPKEQESNRGREPPALP